MSSIVVSGDTSGAITLQAPSVAGTNTITLPALTGTPVIAGQNSDYFDIKLFNSVFVNGGTYKSVWSDTVRLFVILPLTLILL